MKALLEYGQFTAMIHLPHDEPQYMVRVMKPSEGVSLVPLDEIDVSRVEKYALEFRLKDKLSKDVWLYEFVGEV